MHRKLEKMTYLLNDTQIAKYQKTHEKSMFLKGARVYSDKSCRKKTAKVGLKITIDNAMRSGSEFFSIWSPF